MWKIIALILGYREYYDVETNDLVVYREIDHVHYRTWKDAVLHRGR